MKQEIQATGAPAHGAPGGPLGFRAPQKAMPTWSGGLVWGLEALSAGGWLSPCPGKLISGSTARTSGEQRRRCLSVSWRTYVARPKVLAGTSWSACVCVCDRERERDGKSGGRRKGENKLWGRNCKCHKA